MRAMRGMRRGQERRGERGAAAVTGVLFLLVVGGFAALAINVGHMMAVRAQLQNACDAAALAGAQELDGKPEGLVQARLTAADFAQRHATDKGFSVVIDPDADVTFGIWDVSAPKSTAFTPIEESAPDAPKLINAVEVKAGREGARGNPLEVYFAGFLGKKEANVRVQAVAASGGPCEEKCSIPLVFAASFVKTGDTLNCGRTLVFHNDSVDNVGFTNLLDGIHSVNTHDIIETLDEKECRGVKKGQHIGVSNGNNLNGNVVAAFERLLERIAPSRSVTVPIVDAPEGKFNQLNEVVGFATFDIIKVSGPQPEPGYEKNSIVISMKCEEVDRNATSTGCANFGTTAPKPGLVR